MSPIRIQQQVVEHDGNPAIVLPKALAEAVGLKRGAWVEIELTEGRILVRSFPAGLTISQEDREFVERCYREHEAVFKVLAAGDRPSPED